MRTLVWSAGGGTQSAGIAALICMGKLRPDISVIVDTEREVTQTWDYHESVIVPNLASVGITLHRVPKSKYATVDLYGGKDGESLLIPAFQKNPATGEQGKLPTFCSNEWKVRVVQRFCNELTQGGKDGFVYEQVLEEIREHAEEYPKIALGLYKIAFGGSRKWQRKRGGLMPLPKMPRTLEAAM